MSGFPVDASPFVKLASEWHGGQGSALYSLASTGMFHSQVYAAAVYSEVCHIIRMIRMDHEDYEELCFLRDTADLLDNDDE
jgi:hypothetical protein